MKRKYTKEQARHIATIHGEFGLRVKCLKGIAREKKAKIWNKQFEAYKAAADEIDESIQESINRFRSNRNRDIEKYLAKCNEASIELEDDVDFGDLFADE